MFIGTAFAQAAESAQAAPGGGAFSSILMMVVIFAIFYFILIRPQQKKMKEHKKMVEELKKGDRIITSGGMYATVENATANTLTVKIAEGVKVKLTRSSVGAVVKAEEEKE
jgi:preprotein translocase subunit YajC